MNDRLKAVVPALAEVLAAAFAIDFFFWEISTFDPVSRWFHFRETPVAWAAPVSAAIAAFLLLYLPARKKGWEGLKESGKNWLPLIPAGLLLLIPFTRTPLPLLGAFLLTAWGCYRHCVGTGEALPFEDRVKRLTPRGGLLLSFLLAAIGCFWGFHMQEAAFNRFFLFHSDWGIYAEHYLKLASGGGSLHDWLVAGGHWNGALNLLMTAAILVSPSPETMFLMNSVLIYSAVPLIYLLGRQLKLPPGVAVAFCFFFLLTPVVSNQPLSLFYSFHPINLLPSCFLLFFLFRERKWHAAAVAVLIFTLFIQETAAVFWFGYALVLAVEKRYKTAAVLAVSMAALFVVLSHWVIPAGATGMEPDGGNYTQMFHFSQLGNTPLEVVLSPVLRPTAFFLTLFAVNNFEFVLFLLLPFVFLLPYYPKLLLAGLPLLAGVLLQSSRDLQNVVLQYGVELNCLVIAAALFGAAKLYAGGNRRKLRGALAAALLGVAALFLLAGKSPGYGKYSFSMILERPECDKLILFFKSCLPPGETVHAPQRIRAHLLFDNPTRDPNDPATPGAVYILEAQPGTEDDRLRRQLLDDPAVTPVTCVNWYGHQFVVLRKLAKPAPRPELPFLKAVTPEGFAAFGSPVESASREFRIRSRMTENAVQLLFLLTRKVEGDFCFEVKMTRGAESIPYMFIFANGLRTASQTEPGTAFFAELPLPEGSGPVAIRVEAVQVR